LPAATLGLLSALLSALVWGSGDFTGGLAARRASQYQVLALAAVSGSILLAALMLLRGEPLPAGPSLLWAAAAGVSGSIGIAALYRGLAVGRAAIVAPVSAVVSAVLPVIVGAFWEGLPGWPRLIGFGVALAGLWFVSQSAAGGGGLARHSLLLAVVAGLGFGGFFVLIALVEGGVFAPLLVARLMYLIVAGLLLLALRVPVPSLRGNPAALLAGALDIGGNVFYVLAQNLTRLDVAAVLASLYPAGTVLLAWVILKERLSASQWLGAGLCLLAVILIAL
jgi:drug/metabolite transporter (DMT)-like permease